MKTPAFAFGRQISLLLVLAGAPLFATDELAPPARNPATHILLGPVETSIVAAVKAADDERVAAILAGDAARLEAVLSDDLRYTHANGRVDTKRSFRDVLAKREIVYAQYAYSARDFFVATPDIVLMTGRVLIKAASATDSIASEVSVLAVWRLEGGKWRFLAWQSAKPPPSAAK